MDTATAPKYMVVKQNNKISYIIPPGIAYLVWDRSHWWIECKHDSMLILDNYMNVQYVPRSFPDHKVWNKQVFYSNSILLPIEIL
jgi:hypothetical protein